MRNPTTSPDAAAAATKGTFIFVGGDDPDYVITSKLLATIARPPATPAAPKWLELVRAFNRWILHLQEIQDRASFERPEMFIRAHLAFPLARAEKLVRAAFERVSVAMGAAHTQMPALVRGLVQARGKPLSLMGEWRHEHTLTHEIERVLRQEAEFGIFLKGRGQSLPDRFPAIESGGAPVNFRNRVIRPFRGVLHLATGLAQVLDTAERQLAKDAGAGPIDWVARGFGEYPDPRPRLLAEHLLMAPPIAIAAINRAQMLEAGLPYLAAQRPEPHGVIRLRWKPTLVAAV